MIREATNPEHRRLRQLERTLLIVGLLAPLRRGASADEICRDVSDELGERWCRRTIARDLGCLEALGVVERESGGHWEPTRWRCRATSLRAAVFQRLAELRSDARDPWPAADGKGGER